MINVKQAIKDNSTEDDDYLCIASKYWERIMDAAAKTGYREGIQDGEDSVLQDGFDMGYKDGFETGFVLGRYKSLVTTMSPTLEHPVDISAVLEKTKRGACWICSTDSQNETKSRNEHVPFSDMLHNQRIHSIKITKRLREYVESFLEK